MNNQIGTKGGIMETFKELLNFACFIIIMYFLFCVLQYAPQMEQLIIEMKGEQYDETTKRICIRNKKELTILKKES